MTAAGRDTMNYRNLRGWTGRRLLALIHSRVVTCGGWRRNHYVTMKQWSRMSSTAAAPVSSPLLPISCLSTSSTQSSSSSSLSSPLLGQRSRTVLNKDNQLKLSCLPGPSASPSLSMNSYRSSQSSSSSCQSRSGTCDMITNIRWGCCNSIFDVRQRQVLMSVDDTPPTSTSFHSVPSFKTKIQIQKRKEVFKGANTFVVKCYFSSISSVKLKFLPNTLFQPMMHESVCICIWGLM